MQLSPQAQKLGCCWVVVVVVVVLTIQVSCVLPAGCQTTTLPQSYGKIYIT